MIDYHGHDAREMTQVEVDLALSSISAGGQANAGDGLELLAGLCGTLAGDIDMCLSHMVYQAARFREAEDAAYGGQSLVDILRETIDTQAARIAEVEAQRDKAVLCYQDVIIRADRAETVLGDVTREAEHAARILRDQRDHARHWANFWRQNWGEMQDDPDLDATASDGWKVGDAVP